MFSEASQASNIVGDVTAVGSQSVAGTESEAASCTSSSTMADEAIAKKDIPPLYQYWKALTVTDKDTTAFHDTDWLLGALLFTPTTMDFLTID
jgi:hypothetical protein